MLTLILSFVVTMALTLGVMKLQFGSIEGDDIWIAAMFGIVGAVVMGGALGVIVVQW